MNLKPVAPHSTDDPPWMRQQLVMRAIRNPEEFTLWDVGNETSVHHQARAVIIALGLDKKEG